MMLNYHCTECGVLIAYSDYEFNFNCDCEDGEVGEKWWCSQCSDYKWPEGPYCPDCGFDINDDLGLHGEELFEDEEQNKPVKMEEF